jgi:hypothetical protein
LDVQKKIKLRKQETFVVNALKDKYGQEADELLSAVYEKLPLPDKNASLDEILSNTPTHQGIQNLIINAETREASSISAFCNKFGDEAKSLVITAAHDHSR